ncbi:unnamed protein product [Meganyctiphanes norvegica]|uniref:Uncharacterized protein n=1 Tax=Meganyctiphanes norvegica TaxID=48144 RepID=A0AAV2S2E9_MEGNR
MINITVLAGLFSFLKSSRFLYRGRQRGVGDGYILENIIKSALMVLLGNNLWSYIDIIDIIYLYQSQNMQNTSIFSTIILFTMKATWRPPYDGFANATWLILKVQGRSYILLVYKTICF